MPRTVSRPSARKRKRHIAPSVARVTAWATPPNIQQPLARCIKVEESKDHSPLCCGHGVITANQFVVRHAAVRQDHGAPGLDPYVRTEWKARPKHQRVEQIAFKSYIGRYRTIVERARQRRNEIHAPRRAAFDETAAWNLDYHIYFRPQGQFVIIDGPIAVCVFHLSTLTQCVRWLHTRRRRGIAGCQLPRRWLLRGKMRCGDHLELADTRRRSHRWRTTAG